MKKSTLLLILLFTVFLSYSQKIQLKKGLLSKDNVPFGKLEGEATLLNGTNISIKSMEDAPLINIHEPRVTFGSPFYEPIRFYSIKFVPLQKTVAFIPEKFFMSEKKLVEYLFENIGNNFLGNEGLNAEVIDKFIASKDQSGKIAKDTVHISNLVKADLEKTNEPLIDRPEKDRVELSSLKKETTNAIWYETLQTFNIVKGNVVIGKLIKRYKGDPSISSSSTTPQSKEVEYVVKRRVKPFMLDGEEIEYVNLAKVKSSLSKPEINMYCERKYSKTSSGAYSTDLEISDVYNAEYQIVTQLIERGCL
ncbi:MAG TPA: hypothetical protein VIM65_04740 [Cyclobacteriaceae bacterium]